MTKLDEMAKALMLSSPDREWPEEELDELLQDPEIGGDYRFQAKCVLDCLMDVSPGMVDAAHSDLLGADCTDAETAIDASACCIRAALQAVKDGK